MIILIDAEKAFLNSIFIYDLKNLSKLIKHETSLIL